MEVREHKTLEEKKRGHKHQPGAREYEKVRRIFLSLGDVLRDPLVLGSLPLIV
jgi:hypothetical protein